MIEDILLTTQPEAMALLAFVALIVAIRPWKW